MFENHGDDFTHAAIVVSLDNGLVVAHADPRSSAVVHTEHLADLLRSDDMTSIAIYHPRVSVAAAARAAQIALKYANRRTPFDFDFDSTDDRAVYCTELVWLAYRDSGLRIKPSGRIVFPSDLLRTGFFEARSHNERCARCG